MSRNPGNCETTSCQGLRKSCPVLNVAFEHPKLRLKRIGPETVRGRRASVMAHYATRIKRDSVGQLTNRQSQSRVNPPVPLSERAREFPNSRREAPRATLWVLLGPPRATLFELLRGRGEKSLFSLAENEKTPGTGLTGQASWCFCCCFLVGKRKLPASNPLRNVAREIRREVRFS